MPPKARFKKEEIIQTALYIVRQNGFEALTARALGAELHSSARPIFTVFQNMEEVQAEVRCAIKEVYNQYIQHALTMEVPFKAVGLSYIQFAKEEPKLFQILFMSEAKPKPKAESIMYNDDNHVEICKAVEDMYGLSHSDAWHLYEQLWIYCHGIATLCVSGACGFDDEEISKQLSELFKGLISNIKRRE